MAVEFREFTADDDLEPCLELQRLVFGYSETELVSPLILGMIVRNRPPMGIMVGAFADAATAEGPPGVDTPDGTARTGGARTLVGLMVGLASFESREVHVAFGGVLPAWQAGTCPFRVFLAFREAALKRGLVAMSAIHDPLEEHLARLYYNGVGYRGLEYLTDSSNKPIPADRVRARWDFTAPGTLARLSRTPRPGFKDVQSSIPRVSTTDPVDAPRVLLAIPEGFSDARKADPPRAAALRMESRHLLDLYLNRRDYAIVDCLSERTGTGRRSWYLLEKTPPQNGEEQSL